MRARLVTRLPEGPGWEYEVKWDGYRALVLRASGRTDIVSRNNRLLNDRFPQLIPALASVPAATILDGEIVAFDPNGRPSFNMLQNAGRETPLLFYAFDVLAARGRDLLGAPLGERRDVLRDVVTPGTVLRVSEPLHASAAEMVSAARRQGLEGVVAKRVDSLYLPGRRSDAWLKYQVHVGHEGGGGAPLRLARNVRLPPSPTCPSLAAPDAGWR